MSRADSTTTSGITTGATKSPSPTKTDQSSGETEYKVYGDEYMKLACNASFGLLLTLAGCRGNTNSGLQVSLNKLQHEVKAGIDKPSLVRKLNGLDFYEHSSTSYSEWQLSAKVAGETMPFKYIPSDVSSYRIVVYALDGKPSITGYRLYKTAYILFEDNTPKEMVFE